MPSLFGGQHLGRAAHFSTRGQREERLSLKGNSSACCRSLISNKKMFLSQCQWQIVTAPSVQARSQKTTLFSVCLKNTALCRHRGNSVIWSRTQRGVWQRSEGSKDWCEAIPEVKQRQRSCTTSHPRTLLTSSPISAAST